jgi:hypothetical protein
MWVANSRKCVYYYGHTIGEDTNSKGEMTDLLTSLLKIGGVTGLTIGVFYLLYRQVLSLRIFGRLGPTQTLVLISLLAILVWLTAMTALVRNDQGLSSLIVGSGNQVLQGTPVR